MSTDQYAIIPRGQLLPQLQPLHSYHFLQSLRYNHQFTTSRIFTVNLKNLKSQNLSCLLPKDISFHDFKFVVQPQELQTTPPTPSANLTNNSQIYPNINMSADALPISPAAFAEALKDLPMSTLHLKAAELRNSIAHLDYSNEELKPFAEGRAPECVDGKADEDWYVVSL